MVDGFSARSTPCLDRLDLAYIYPVPEIAAISSWLQLGERPGPAELAGMLLIGIALALISLLSIKRQERTDDGAGVAAIIAPDSASLSEFL